MERPGRVIFFWVCLILLHLLSFSTPNTGTAAEAYPNKPLNYTLFFPPGGRSDIVARMLAPYLEKTLGTPVVITSNSGGAGVIGHKFIKEVKPDGYTVAQSGTTPMFQYTKPGISMWDYTWVANIYSAPFFIAVPANSPFKTLKELVEYGKANPQKLRHGNTGTGGTTHLGSESFARRAGIEFTQIAYKGEGPSVIGVASGEVDVAFGVIAALNQMADAGKVRLLAVCDDRRHPKYSQVPTCKEAGYNFEYAVWEAIFGPKGLQENKAVYPKLSDAVRKAIQDPDFGKKMSSIGLDVRYRGGDELLKWLKEIDRDIKKITYDLGLEYK